MEKKIIKPIEDSENVVSTFIESLKKDKDYQNRLAMLKKSDAKKQKKATRIEKTFSSLRIYKFEDEQVFLARDIGILMGITTINIKAKKYRDNEKRVGYIINKKGKLKEVIFLTRAGVYRSSYNGRNDFTDIVSRILSKLIDHMLIHEKEKVMDYVDEVREDNPVLFERGLTS